MSELIIFLGVVTAILIGANSSGNCVGPGIGCGAYSRKFAIGLLVIFVSAGILVEGSKMVGAVEGGILGGAVSTTAVAFALLSALAAMAVATYFKMPVSSSQPLAVSFALSAFLAGSAVNFAFVGKIFATWLLTPVASGILAALIYAGYFRFRKHLRAASRNSVSYVLLILSSAYAAYALGANTNGFLISIMEAVPADVGLVYAVNVLAMVAGIVFLSGGVTKTIGGGIADMGLMTAMSAQFAAALIMHFFTQFHIPVSLSQAVVGGVAGIGIAYGSHGMTIRQLKQIVDWWVFTPLIAAVAAFGLYLI